MGFNQKMRNIGILAHVDAGKTTITENMLFKSGKIRSLGRVDEGTAQTDWLDVEKKRGISVRAASTSFNWKGVNINLIDTPGHVDFSAEVERSLMVMDGAVLVISAAEGVEVQTEILWNALQTMEIPTLIFINKIDRIASNCSTILSEIDKYLSPDIIPLESIEGEATKEPVVKRFDEISEQSAKDQETRREEIYEFMAERDEELLNKYLNEEQISNSELNEKILELTSNREIYPVFFGSALNGVGVAELLDGIVKYLPSPLVPADDFLSGIIFKIDHDPTMGRLASVRLFSGTIENRDSVYNMTKDISEKVTQIRKIYARRHEDVGLLEAGDIATVCGFNQAQVGDILGSSELVPEKYHMAVPLLKVQVSPINDEDYPKLIEVLTELADEDPLLSLQWFREEQEIHLKIMGMIQVEVLTSILKNRYEIEVEFSRPSVIYKETPASVGEGYVRYTMPKPCWAVLRFKIEPGARGSGVKYSSEVRPDKILQKYQNHVKQTIPEALKQGLYGWEVTDLKITLIDGEYHIEHTHPQDFMVATPMGIMDGFVNTGIKLLEPVVEFQITVPEDLGGQILSDIVQMRGDFKSPRIKNGKFNVEGTVPVATSLDYSVKLSSMSSGRGIMKTKFFGYQECPLESGAKCPRQGVNPLDRSRYILSVRKALSS